MNFLATFEKLNNILEEGIDDLYRNQLFSKIPRETLLQIVAADPTANVELDKKGKYSSWLLTLYAKANLKLEDLYKATEYLTDFDKYKHKLEKRDISQYKSLPELFDAIEEVKSRVPTAQDLKKDAHRAGKDIEAHADKLFENDQWIIWIPKDHAGACSLARVGGSQAQWCTATPENDYYYKQYTNQGPLFVIINKDDPVEKYQYHFESCQFMDRTDRQIDGAHFLDKNGLYTPIAQKIADTYFDGKLGETEAKLDFTDFIACIAEVSRGHTDVGDDLFKELLTGELDWFGYYDEASLRDYFHLADVSDENMQQLRKLNPDIPAVISRRDFDTIEEFLDEYFDEEICDFRYDLDAAFISALCEGNTIGAEDECYRDFEKALKDCFRHGYTIDRDKQEISFIGYSGDIICQSMDGECDELNFEYKTDIYKAICMNLLEENFRFYEPQYGWNDFSEDAFNSRLYDELYEIVTNHVNN